MNANLFGNTPNELLTCMLGDHLIKVSAGSGSTVLIINLINVTLSISLVNTSPARVYIYSIDNCLTDCP